MLKICEYLSEKFFFSKINSFIKVYSKFRKKTSQSKMEGWIEKLKNAEKTCLNQDGKFLIK